MPISLTEEEVKKLKELLVAKTECYAQIKEIQHYAENFAIGVWMEQKRIEEKYKVDFASGKHKLNLMENTIETVDDESKIIT